MISSSKQIERCILIGLVRLNQSRWTVEDHLKELKLLAGTSGAEVIESFIQQRVAPDPAYFIGKGKVEELSFYIEAHGIDTVIFDDELSPAQMRNIERILERKVIDRSALILDIFAQHARSREAKVQVELAQLNYLLPRLTRQWQHLSRQVGGIGTKGPGETQLETDRRLVRRRIAHLKNRLERIDNQKYIQRRQRKKLFKAALIGYTNAGKSTLLNTLSNANIFTEDKLFATLDTTVRRVQLEQSSTILLSDTVGFIRKLPHHLVASFRTTLAETVEADLLIHVVDLSHPNYEEHIRVVNQILADLHLSDKDYLLVFNKVDLIDKTSLIKQLHLVYPDAVFISAARHLGIKTLKKHIGRFLQEQYVTEVLKLNYGHGGFEHKIQLLASILDRKYDEQNFYLTIKYNRENKSKIQRLLKKYTE